MDAQVKTLQQAIRYFGNEDVCIDTVANLRWPDGIPRCPKCVGTEHYYLKTQKRWKCKKCGRQFSVKQGTIFEDSPLSLDKWLSALWVLVNCDPNVSSHEIAYDLCITQKSAWFMLRRLRLALRSRRVPTAEAGDGESVETGNSVASRNTGKEKAIRC